ncbi:MAG: ATP-grasp domain-containing protein, partial [Aurantimicrobium sp.]
VGPSPSAIEKLGDKIEARKIAASVGAPLVQGTQDPLNNADEALEFAKQFGLPIAIKAAFGGGGRGLKVVWKLEDVKELYDSAVREAQAAFGRGECFVEQYLDQPRHVEAQVIADQHGNVVVLGTRDCSLQRRNQKLVEEAPAPFISDAIYEEILTSAKNICQAANYVGAGTVEYLLSRDGK